MFYKPMLLEECEEPFNSEDYIFEPKMNGIRLILSRFNGVTKLYTRHENDVTGSFPELHNVVEGDIVLDGELIAFSEDKKDEFEKVMQRFPLTNKDKIAIAMKENPIQLVCFDILHEQQRGDLRSLNLLERKSIWGLANISDKSHVKVKRG